MVVLFTDGFDDTHPEHPLESGHSDDHQALEEQAQAALSPCETSIQQPNARNDEPDQEAANDEVYIMEFETVILGVDVDSEGVTTPRL